MSRRKDKERFQRMKRLDAGYKGFRGHQEEPSVPPRIQEVVPVVCIMCGRKRNVAYGTSIPQEGYICLTCKDSTITKPTETTDNGQPL